MSAVFSDFQAGRDTNVEVAVAMVIFAVYVPMVAMIVTVDLAVAVTGGTGYFNEQ